MFFNLFAGTTAVQCSNRQDTYWSFFEKGISMLSAVQRPKIKMSSVKLFRNISLILKEQMQT